MIPSSHIARFLLARSPFFFPSQTTSLIVMHGNHDAAISSPSTLRNDPFLFFNMQIWGFGTITVDWMKFLKGCSILFYFFWLWQCIRKGSFGDAESIKSTKKINRRNKNNFRKGNIRYDGMISILVMIKMIWKNIIKNVKSNNQSNSYWSS